MTTSSEAKPAARRREAPDRNLAMELVRVTEAAGVLDAGLVLADRFAPLTSCSTLHAVPGDRDHVAWTRRRESCCFHYLIDAGQGVCETCPRVLPKR